MNEFFLARFKIEIVINTHGFGILKCKSNKRKLGAVFHSNYPAVRVARLDLLLSQLKP
jgi:hypothetical protein